MNLEAAGYLGAVARRVTLVEVEGKPSGAVTLSRSFGTSVEDLWGAVTEAERISRWFLPVTGELVEGGRYALEGNASGSVTACEKFSYFALTWEFAGDVSWVEVRVSDDGCGRARLELTHTAVLSKHWDTFGPGAVGVGWEMGMLGLAVHVEQPDEPQIDEAAFVSSVEGRAFVAGSSEAWGEAWVMAGANAEAARTAAARTAAFYTGEPFDTD